MPKRCALGCPFTSQSYHQFPHPYRNLERFKAWVHIAGGKLDCEEDIELFRKKVVCDIHFTDKDKNRNNRLNFLAVPSFHLPGKSDEVGSSEKVLLVPEPANEENSPAVSTPTVIGKFDEVCTSEKVLLAPEPLNEEGGLATSKPAVTDHCAGIMASEHSYCRRENKAKKQKKSTHQQLEVPSLWLNELKAARRKIKILQSTLIRSQKKNKSLQSRIAYAEKMSTADVLLKKLTANMTIPARIFTKMQYSQTSKKPSGRRFSMEEKVLSLSLYKKSPRSYPLLAKYFTLPSAKSLKRLDENISRSRA